MSKVELISLTPDAEKTMAYIARVSNPKNQGNEDYSKLLSYCIKNEHWSVFEQAFMTLQIETNRGIAAQILPPSVVELVETTLFNLIDQGFGAGILGAMFLLFTAGNAYLSLQRGADRLWEDEIPSKKISAAWREQASRLLRNRIEAFLIVFFIGFLMVLDQISANLRMIPSNVLENISKSNNLISHLLLKLPLLQVGQFAIPLIGFSLMALLLQALLPSRKVPLKPLLPGSFLIWILLTTLNLAVSKSILSLGVRFQAYGFIGGFLVLTLWVWLLGVILYFGQCWSVVIASMTLVNKKRNYR